MKPSSLRDMTKDELMEKLSQLRQALFNLKFQHVTGQLENTAQIPKTRKDIAQILTVLHEMEHKPAA